jgi:hypothetical protein
MASKNGIYHLVNEGGLANESIFAIILQTFNELTAKDKLLNSVTTITDWSRMSSPTSPYLFKEATDENINIISNLLKENPNAMFLRKVDREFPDQSILNIMNIDSNTQLIIKKKDYNSYYFSILFLGFTFLYCMFL